MSTRPNLSWTFNTMAMSKVQSFAEFPLPRTLFPFYCNPPSIYSPFLVSDREVLFVRVPFPSIYSSVYVVFSKANRSVLCLVTEPLALLSGYELFVTLKSFCTNTWKHISNLYCYLDKYICIVIFNFRAFLQLPIYFHRSN